MKVISQGDVTYIPSQKEANGQLAKCVIRLKGLGGKFGDEFVCALFGNLALGKFFESDTVIAVLRFQVHEANGVLYQDVICNDIIKISK